MSSERDRLLALSVRDALDEDDVQRERCQHDHGVEYLHSLQHHTLGRDVCRYF